ncbi:hypothetical protein [Paenibacillus sp. V4I7]|uniref:hypothetical protein n=1 Tax=Paenibacillus sp. V4I7 TaxID=3042307 RepID=UPI0027816D29|nr:hypothetical protein [Paenibacillus sp. V4I7]MDQ0899372.1 hypothetical protein [Paenibacillus sp. V4I7]
MESNTIQLTDNDSGMNTQDEAAGMIGGLHYVNWQDCVVIYYMNTYLNVVKYGNNEIF